ncbi:hypothetical protein PHSY_001273 [Pseudozyma hubeiensis SY62]|uniref:Uncharacterized protein n=1 Tax=Pseudozyma hubeiensis (strain SY62) TaxID=1305764 RepID=R9NY74_PSEHS|nr:hypothetical protein PHSY_001273 [Pseudozyma hubeiensis SY62]GAC93708.1 hypothetical protein PHSY_001273 [Pseudozyma hubeiensis SY62]
MSTQTRTYVSFMKSDAIARHSTAISSSNGTSKEAAVAEPVSTTDISMNRRRSLLLHIRAAEHVIREQRHQVYAFI